MKGWYNELNIILLVISNLVAIFQLVTSVKWPRIARASFFILFAWACWINLKNFAGFAARVFKLCIPDLE